MSLLSVLSFVFFVLIEIPKKEERGGKVIYNLLYIGVSNNLYNIYARERKDKRDKRDKRQR